MWHQICYICVGLLLFLIDKGTGEEYPSRISRIYAIENSLFADIYGSAARIEDIEPEPTFLDLDDVSPIFDQIHELASAVGNKSIADKFYKLGDLINSKINPLYREFLNCMSNIDDSCFNFVKLSGNEIIKDLAISLFNINELFRSALEEIAMPKILNCNNANITVQPFIFQIYEITIRAYARMTIMFMYENNPQELMVVNRKDGRSDDHYIGPKVLKLRSSMQEILQLAQKARIICRKIPKHYKRNETFIEMENALQYDLKRSRLRGKNTCGFEGIVFAEHERYFHCKTKSTFISPYGFANCHDFQFSLLVNNFGKDESFSSPNIVKLQKRAILPPVPCEFCQFHCMPRIEDDATIQAISFRPQYSDIQHNRVVTGVQFVLQGKMLHIQIKEGTLLPFGRINSTDTWKPIDEVEWKVRNNEGNYFIKQFRLTEKFDYHILSQKSGMDPIISLQTSEVPKGYVITGVKFEYEVQSYDEYDNFPIVLTVQATPFDFVRGQLKLEQREMWTESQFRNSMDIFNPNYFHFKRVTRGGNNITIPFFDIQPVTSSVEYALGGIQLFLRTFGGHEYLAMALSTIDFSAYLAP